MIAFLDLVIPKPKIMMAAVMIIVLLAYLALAQTGLNALQQNAHLGNIVMRLEEIVKLLTLQVMYA